MPIALKFFGAFIALILGLLLLVVAWGLAFGLPGRTPTNLGVQGGKLAPCKTSPNCVSSYAKEGYPAIEPLPLNGEVAAAMSKLAGAVEALPRAKIVSADGPYLYAQQTSKLLGYVDDFEFLADPDANVIHVRSASRLGRKDFGVNRARVEAIRAALASK